MPDLIVKSNVKDALEGYNAPADLYDEVKELLDEAARRADANNRKTLQPHDL